CSFFRRVGACKFGNKCSRVHIIPQQSTTLLFPNMFNSFKLQQTFRNDYNSENDIYEEFKAFYDDVYPEFRKIGKINMFAVCCNIEPHLRGNVYVDYLKLAHALEAFGKFNGRWFDKRQLSCSFVTVYNWKYAICGLFNRNMCLKGKNCNFLHV
ncbi:hypothetical protein HELRODRAFT_67261, partial [Helobdella robusta]|uniref:C3H1-type domain-containing protein n=1 Tax=Helobdella robusta TaxID=6412 RepID=T1FYY9_HELRO